MKLASGHEVETLDGEELKVQERDFNGYTKGLIRLHPGRWLFTTPFLELADKIYNFKVNFFNC